MLKKGASAVLGSGARSRPNTSSTRNSLSSRINSASSNTSAGDRTGIPEPPTEVDESLDSLSQLSAISRLQNIISSNVKLNNRYL